MATGKISMSILITLICLCGFNTSGHSSDNTGKDTLEYKIERKHIVFISNDKPYRFTIYLSPFGYFMPGNIYQGFKKDHSPFSVGPILDSLRYKFIIKPEYVTDPKIDTLHNYFDGNDLQGNRGSYYEMDSATRFIFRLEFEYSFLLNQVEFSSEFGRKEGTAIRLITLDEGIDEGNSLKIRWVALENNIAKFHNKLLEIKNPSDVRIAKEDSVIMKPRHVKRLRKKLKGINFNTDQNCIQVPPSACALYSLLEYSGGGTHNHYWLCGGVFWGSKMNQHDFSPSKVDNINKMIDLKEFLVKKYGL
ncbi:MAG: hypothetical protein K9I94_02505 [Bacteroidales bacterium]|nr:hypothetical protein [Bacteroidales bacterium]